jgi:hypothetical protein
MTKSIIIKFNLDGFHNYPDPPKEVDFLKNIHRHTFVIKAAYKVSHSNREKEIFICRGELKDYINECYGNPAQFRNMSCEMIAEELLEFGSEDGMIWVEVWEENTGGARVEK